MWHGHSKFSAASLVYAVSRYSNLIQAVLGVATIYPMSDLVRNIATPFLFHKLNMVAHGEVA